MTSDQFYIWWREHGQHISPVNQLSSDSSIYVAVRIWASHVIPELEYEKDVELAELKEESDKLISRLEQELKDERNKHNTSV